MKFYATIEPCRKLKNLFSNLSQFYIIDVDILLSESGLDMSKPSHVFLANSEIERLIINGIRSKRYMGIIYINSNLNCDIISAIRKSLDSVETSQIDSLVVLDDYDIPKLKNYYSLFDEVVFFPSLKKIKIIECVPNSISKIRKMK